MTIQFTSLVRTLALAGVLLPSVGAAAPQAPAPPGTDDRAGAPAAPVTGSRAWTDEDYRLGPGDKLRIEVFNEQQLSQSLQVRPDGKITLPLVGDVLAAGRTSLELDEALTAGLKEWLTNPVVTVIVQEAVANQVTVMGEVRNIGPQVLMGPTTVVEVLSRAGGFTEFAKQRDIRIYRTTSSGREQIGFDYRDFLNGRTEPLLVQPGDTVVVP